MKVFSSINAIVMAAHDILGDTVPQKKIVDFCNKKINSKEWGIPGFTGGGTFIRVPVVAIGNVCFARHQWRKENKKLGNDCRTYETQFRREMLPDNKINGKVKSEAEAYIHSWGCDGKELDDNLNTMKEFLTKFHSIEQLQIFLDIQLLNNKIMEVQHV